MSEETANYSWVETHRELVKYLAKNQNNQKEMIALLKNLGISAFNDRDADGNIIDLEEIDPFTFFCYIYKFGSQKRLAYLQQIAECLKIQPVPTGESGIPSANAQKVWLFPYKVKRINNEISRLWQLFFDALDDNISDEQFEDILKIRGTGKAKITEALFYINPEKYFPIDAPTKPYLKEKLGINPQFDSYTEYLGILKKIREKTEKPFYELSYEAWKWNSERSKISYWVFQGNPDAFDFETAFKNNLIDDWTVSSHKEKIKKGDKVIIWITGKNSGCYALAEVTQEARIKEKSPADHLWKTENQNRLRADIKITHNLVSNPITKEMLENIDELSDLKIGNQGTNFSATEDEYLTLLELADAMNVKGLTDDETAYPLNTIFYGPPGTGKTCNTILRAAQLIENRIITDYKEAQRIFNKNLGDRIEFITFHQNYSYEDFIQGLRPDVNHSGGLAFERKDGVFKRIADRALKSMNDEKNGRKNYVIVIDEINRANISRVFGELITLIEPDKRSHGAIPLQCTLPSGEKFVVPSNLYVIATMNTADKSIALLDIALRRRFEFEPMYPLYEIEGHEIHAVDVLKKINKCIRELKGHDFQIGHAYFMGNHSDLIEGMNKKVIPLLLEYFMNDEKEVKGILESAGLVLENDVYPIRISGLK